MTPLVRLITRPNIFFGAAGSIPEQTGVDTTSVGPSGAGTQGAGIASQSAPGRGSKGARFLVTVSAPLRERRRRDRLRRLRTQPRAVSAAVGFAAVAMGLLLVAPAAQADFGLLPGSVGMVAKNKDGTLAVQAGSHPYAFSVSASFNVDQAGRTEGGEPRDLIVDLPPGLVGNPRAVPQCSRQAFEGDSPSCPGNTQVGVLRANLPGFGQAVGPVYNMVAPPGTAGQIAFSVLGFNALENASVRTEAGYGLRIATSNLPTEITSVTETIWGVPADSAHDPERTCVSGTKRTTGCSSDAPLQSFLTLPTSCHSPPQITVSADSKLAPGLLDQQSASLSDAAGNPSPLAGCDGTPFSPKLTAQPTTPNSTSPSGLDFELKLPDQGLLSPGGIAETEPRKTVVTLPEGVTVNPSFAEGVGVCTPAQYAAERVDTPAAGGCPESSKLGSVTARSPLLDEAIEGAVYLAAPYDNPFGTLTALYLVARAPERGVIVKQAGKVTFDPQTGQIKTTFDDLPPVPYSSFALHFREGARAPLATPSACGEYKTLGEFTPFSAEDDSEAVTTTASFQIEHGPDGGPCPSGGLPPFHPGLIAGTLNNAAGAFSPFNVRLFRTDSEQEIDRFSIKLPPGVVAKLAGVPFCSEAQIASAIARTGPHGGQEELESPSCPAASEIGHSLAGAGVGSALAYAPGKIYLAGPYHGSAISIVAITAAKVGPFDLGTVVIRQALRVNPETGEVFIDATGSDPIPHIINGVPVHLRDIRAYVDRPDFTLNPTSCEPTSTASTLLGSGLDFASEADDNPVVVSTRFQAADCAALPFKPKLSLRLEGQTKRAGNPALHAHLAMNGIGEAGLAFAQVALPKTLFLDNAHINTICTRVQFRQGAIEGEKCPSGSVIGTATATTPILSESLTGPIYLKSNPERELPDLAASLHGAEISVVAVGHTDSAPGGGLRNTFEVIPDAPISSVDIDLFGGKKGLIESSRNLCAYKPQATVKFRGHNGKTFNPKLKMKATGCQKRKAKKHQRPRFRVFGN